MGRRRRGIETVGSVVPPHVGTGPHIIAANAVYVLEEAQKALHLKKSTIRREFREGRLRVAKRAGRHYILGIWLLEWIKAGEMRNPRANARTNGVLS